MDNNIRVEKFLLKELLNLGESLEGCEREFTQLSDHYGLYCTLLYQGKFYFI